MSEEYDEIDDDIDLDEEDESTDDDADDSETSDGDFEPVEVIEDKLRTSEYSKLELTQEELQAAEELKTNFQLFINSNCKKIVSHTKTTVPTGIDVLDTILGGGVSASFVQFVGQPGCGKSAMAARVLATGQKKFAGKFIGVYLDSEESMTKERLKQLGVNYPEIEPIHEVSVEDVFRIVDGLCAFKENNKLVDTPSVVVWDSIASTATEASLTIDDMNKVMGERARVLSFILPKYIRKLNKYNICLLAINQTRKNLQIGPMKKAKSLQFMSGDLELPGGEAAKYYSSQIVELRTSSKVEGEYGFDGSIVTARTIKNKLFAPNVMAKTVFSFEQGFTNFWTNYENLKECKKIKSGAWCTLTSFPTVKFRQKDAITNYKSDTNFQKAWDTDVEDMLKTEFIDKHLTDNDNIDI